MKKIFLIVFIVICGLFICSCDNNNNNDQDQDSSLDGIDISKYEMPQTEFLHDGHKLTKLEELMKFVIEEGKFIYNEHLNSIGYQYVLEEQDKTMLYAYYSVNELKLLYVQTVGKVDHFSYFKLTETDEMFTICHKIQYYSGRRQDFYAIMNCERELFNNSYLGEYELYRGYNTQTKEEINTKIVNQNYQLLQLFDNVVTEKINISLSEFGFNCN